MRKFFQGWFLAAELMLLGCVGAAYANYDGTQGTGTHFVAFDATHSGTSLCAAANTQCVAFVNINSAGTEVGTAAVPFQVTGANGTFPITAASLPLPALAATSTKQSDGSQKSQIVDGSGNVIASTSNAMNVNVNNVNANGQATAANSSPVVLPAAQVTADPCALGTKTNFTISTSSGTLQLVAPSGSTQVYICSLFTIGATASIQNIVGGTGASCTTGTPVAIAGSTTAANGMSFAANGGFTFGNGGGTILRTTTAGHGVCLIQSATALIAGGGTYVQQ